MSETIPEPSAPEPAGSSSRRRAVLIGGVAAAVVALVVAGLLGRSAAEGAADEYRTDLAAWEKEGLPDLVDTATTVPDDLFEVEDPSSKAGLKAQQEQCDALEKSAKHLADGDALDRPEPDGSPLGFLSGSYGDAKDDAAAAGEKVEKYRVQARKTFEQLGADCAYVLKWHGIGADLQTAWKAVEKTQMKPKEQLRVGTRIYTCPGPRTCYPPEVGGRFDKYAKAYDAYMAAYQTWPELDESATCAKSSLGKKLCSVAAKAAHAEVDTQIAWISAVKKAGGDSTDAQEKKLDALWDEHEKTDDGTEKLIADAALDRFPDLDGAKKWKAEDADELLVLVALAEQRIAELTKTAPKA